MKNRIYSMWYSQFLGYLGKGSVISSHCELEGDKLENVMIGSRCYIDSYCIIGCRSRIVSNEKKINSEIRIGDGCMIGQYTHITAINKIVIGRNLLTGRFVLITDNNHGSFTKEELLIHPADRQVISKGEVVIGNNVWLGDKVSILSGVHIGDGCIIGANSVVTRDIPPYSLAVGNPAQVIKTLNTRN